VNSVLADHSWWHTHGEWTLWVAAVVAAIGIIIKTPIGQAILRAVKWVWKRLVSEPLTSWSTRVVGDVVESKVAGKNGGSSLRDQVDSLNNGQEVLTEWASETTSNQADIKQALENIHHCLDTRFADTHERMEKLTEYAEEVLAEAIGAKERIRQLYRALEVPIFEADANGWFTYTNPAFRRLTGLAVEDARGEGWAHSLHPEDRTRVFEMWGRAVGDPTDFTALFRLVNVNTNDVAEVRASANPLHDAHKNVVGWVGTLDAIERSTILGLVETASAVEEA
jgi:PAS domain S-box-containing protein